MSPKHILLGLLIIILWASEWVVAKSIIDVVPSFFLNFIRFSLLGIILCRFLFKAPPLPLHILASIALLYVVLHFGLVFLGMQLGVNAASAIVLGQAGVPFSALLSFLIFKHKLDLFTIFGIIFAFAGLCIVFGSPSILEAPVGFILVLLGVFSWASGNILIARGSIQPILPLLAWLSLFSAPVLGIISAVAEPSWVGIMNEMGPYHWGAIAYIALVTTLIGDGCWYWLLQRFPTHQVVPLMLLLPLFGVLFSITFLSESLTLYTVFGGLLIVGGVAFTFKGHRQKVLLPGD